jgi:hypothetical protein
MLQVPSAAVLDAGVVKARHKHNVGECFDLEKTNKRETNCKLLLSEP